MKTLKFIFTILFVCAISEMHAQDRYLRTEEYPQEITSFVAKHFPNSDIVSIKEEKETRKTEYEVKLRNMEELEFDGDYKIKSIEAKSELPNSVIPEKIREYVAKNYPQNKIEEWKRKRKGQEIELDNGLEILFDFDGNFIKLDD